MYIINTALYSNKYTKNIQNLEVMSNIKAKFAAVHSA